MRVWHVATGKVITVLRAQQALWGAVFSPDGQSVLTRSNGDGVQLSRIFRAAQELVDDSKQVISRCLTREQREQAFLAPEPPAWCIELEKWPYDTQDWKDWLTFKRANANPPLPDTAEWQPFLAAHRSRRKFSQFAQNLSQIDTDLPSTRGIFRQI